MSVTAANGTPPTSTTPNSTTSTSTTPAGAGIRDVDPATLKSWLANRECDLVDVREPDEFAREHIHGARLAPLSSFDARTHTPPAGKRVVFQCKSGRRSMDAARATLAAGPAGEIWNLAGGIEKWKSAGLAVESNTSAPRLGVMQQTQFTIGVGVVAGVAVGYFAHPLGYLLSAFMGMGLMMAGLTGFCPLATLISKLPWNRASGGSCCTPK